MTHPTDHVPDHIAIIMDGNGRWAESRGLPRAVGHEKGVEALRRVVEACKETPVRYLTVFSFSTENWKRPASEISALFALLRLYVRQDLKRLAREGVRIRVVGSRDGLPDDILALIEQAESETRDNDRFNLNIAFNYGGREEITQACKRLAQACLDNKILPEDITNEAVEEMLWFASSPEPDLLIRTSGEYRLSNFLLWQIAYSELVFTDKLWPDFDKTDLAAALAEYAGRNRRFGGLVGQTAQSKR